MFLWFICYISTPPLSWVTNTLHPSSSIHHPAPLCRILEPQWPTSEEVCPPALSHDNPLGIRVVIYLHAAVQLCKPPFSVHTLNHFLRGT